MVHVEVLLHEPTLQLLTRIDRNHDGDRDERVEQNKELNENPEEGGLVIVVVEIPVGEGLRMLRVLRGVEDVEGC